MCRDKVDVAKTKDAGRKFFFFQAEDGIRDYKVTGVQTLLFRSQGRAESVAASMPPARVYKAVSIKPHKSATSLAPTWNFPADGFAATHVTLQSLIQWAYGVEGFQISGAPDWLNTDRYDVEAKVDSSVANELRNLSEEQR